jgi:hypothetical protein
MNSFKKSATDLNMSARAVQNSTINSNAVDVINQVLIGVICTIASGGTPTGTIKLQGSNDGTNWVDHTSATFTAQTGTFGVLSSSSGFGYSLARVQVNETGNVASTATATLVAKGPR